MWLCDSSLLKWKKVEDNAYNTEDRPVISNDLFAVITSDGICAKMNLGSLLKVWLVKIWWKLITKNEFKKFVLKSPDAQLKLELLQKRWHFIAWKDGIVVKYWKFDFVIKPNWDVLVFKI